LKATLDRLASKEGQMLSHLERLDRDVAEGWKWLKDHQNEFEKEVFGPPMLTCSVKDMRYSDMIQAMLQRGDFLCFTSQTKEDHKKLSDQFYRKMGLSVTIRTTFSTLDSFRPPLPRDELRRLGFDGYVTDYLEGPEPVLAMLCGERKLHASAVALQDISDEQYELILQNERLNQFAAHRKMYRIVRRREYGPGAVSTRVNQINRGRFWTEEPADAAEKEEIERQIDDINTQGRKLQEEQEAKKKLHETLEAERVELNKMIVCLPFLTICRFVLLLTHPQDDMQRQKNELQAAYTKWQELPNEIGMAPISHWVETLAF
jgi:chromosome segregation ATPase